MYTLDETRPVWAEINLDNLAHNIREVRKHTDKNALVTAVVKANGYGHGSLEISRTFLDNGADRLAVALLTEAIELRKGNITEPILILGYTPPTQYEKLLEYNIIQAIYNYEDAKILSNKAVELGKKATIHIKIDSGMGRIGFLPTEDSIKDIIGISKLPNIYVEGIFTHLAKADEIDKSHAMEQFERYMKVVNDLEKQGLNIPIKHVSNSAGIIDIPKFNLNMVRAGIMIYGFYPSEEVEKNMELKPAMTLRAKISHLKVVPKGTGISYGQIFVTEKESKIATIPIGYADGFTRMLTGKAEVTINGQRARIVGKICMDQCMIDVTHIDDVKLGDEVVIFGYGLDYPTADELASKLGTINYEIVCMVGRRVPRVYMSNEKIVKIKDYLLE
ncbi:alanine racemase [Tissierella sp.]|uniref:alanine racemase n=1 Tax=Tissierella sp. TaxID=41274 RepID=UPI0028ADB846|nr:alanine racemase [Tissierella sp.]